MIETKIVCDSIGTNGVRLTTFLLTYPRFIHSEFMTHRMISRNASSSRAIPVKKQIQMVIDNPAIPLAFRKNQKGMQAGEVLNEKDHRIAESLWLIARDNAVDQAQRLADLEVHKQYANRLLEPFSHITVVATATDWANFFALRIHPAAQPEICELATQMYALYSSNKPKQLSLNDWHLPFVDDEDKNNHLNSLGDVNSYLIKMSVARCARVSYLNHEGAKPTLEQDLQLYDRLLRHTPIHASPAEHQAMVIIDKEYYGNFKGWLQYRKTLDNENIVDYKRS